MKSPVAWIPSSAAAVHLREIARSLNVFVDGLPLVKTLQGQQQISTPEVLTTDFDLRYNADSRVVQIPDVYVDLATWQYLPAQTVSGGPSSSEDFWLRIALPTYYQTFDPDTLKYVDFWATLNIGSATYEWVQDSEADPYPPGNGGFVPNADSSIHYCYIARVTGGVLTPYFISKGLIKGFLS
jgi:hypothetical protein